MSRLALSVSLTIVLGTASALAAPALPTPSPTATATATPADPIDRLNATDLTKALDFLQKNYVTPSAFDALSRQRAEFAGLLERLGRSASIGPAKPEPAAAPAPFYHELIAGHIGYLRPGALRPSDVAALDDALKDLGAKKADALILDLRATSAAGDFPAAAEFANRFVAKGAPLFSLRASTPGKERSFTSDRSPSYSGFISVLIDEETMGTAEVVASVLRARTRAILIGQTTAGCAVGYSELPLGPDLMLRVASTEAVLPEQEVGIPHGVAPDIAVAMPHADKVEIFAQSLTKSMAPFVFEEDQPHLNEAALLAGTNPEIEAMQDRQQKRARGEKPGPHDPVVQRAVDVITSIGVYAPAAGRTP